MLPLSSTGEQTNAGATSLQRLVEVLASPEAVHADKWKAVQEIQVYGDKAVTNLVRLLLTTGSNDSKYYAIRALGYLGDSTVTDALCNILSNRQFGGRRYAAMALGQIRDPRAVSALEEALDDVDFVRSEALDALVKIDSPESIRALERYYFADSDSRLVLSATTEKPVYALGDAIQIQARLKNVSKETILLAEAMRSQWSCLVFQRFEGGFVEEVDTGLREDRAASKPVTLAKLVPDQELDWRFSGTVQKWTRGEKDDHSFVVGGEPFLTLNFQYRAYHIRRPGKYQVRIVLRQGTREIGFLKSAGLPEDQIKGAWNGVVVSAPATFTVQ